MHICVFCCDKVFSVLKCGNTFLRKRDKNLMSLPISLVMIVKNESRCLARCLKAVQPYVNEMIIVDTGSTDNTVEIATSFGAKTYSFEWVDDFSAARNYALSKATHDWRLVLDADEILQPLKFEDLNHWILQNSDTIGVITCWNLQDEQSKIKVMLPRLLPKEVLYTGTIHEQINKSYQRAFCPITIHHDGYLQVFNDLKFQRNTPLLLKELQQYPDNPYLYYQLAKTYQAHGDEELAYPYFKKWMQLEVPTKPYAVDGWVRFLDNCRILHHFDEGLSHISAIENNCSSNSDFYFSCGLFFMELAIVNPTEAFTWLELMKDCYLKALALGDTGDLEGSGTYLAEHNLSLYYSLMGNLTNK